MSTGGIRKCTYKLNYHPAPGTRGWNLKLRPISFNDIKDNPESLYNPVNPDPNLNYTVSLNS